MVLLCLAMYLSFGCGLQSLVCSEEAPMMDRIGVIFGWPVIIFCGIFGLL
jgi:hypothetical protein